MNLEFMQLAIDEAKKAAEENEVPIGAVIVREGKVIACAHNKKEEKNSAVFHAEIEAILMANKALGNWYLDKTEMYVTLEPCPMCAGAILNSRIEKLYFGAYDVKAGVCGSLYNILTDKRFNHRVEVTGGVMEKECGEILTEYFKNRRKK